MEEEFIEVKFLESDYLIEVSKKGTVKHNSNIIKGQLSSASSRSRRISYTLNRELKTIQRSHLIWNVFNPNDKLEKGEVIVFKDYNLDDNKIFNLNNLHKIKRKDHPTMNKLDSCNRGKNDNVRSSFYANFNSEKLKELEEDLKNTDLKLSYLAFKYSTSDMSISRARKKLRTKKYLK